LRHAGRVSAFRGIEKIKTYILPARASAASGEAARWRDDAQRGAGSWEAGARAACSPECLPPA
jgi:hypothetical protein